MSAPGTVIPKPPASSRRMDEFRELMESFNQASRQLENTHVDLRNQVGRLQAELAEANERLRMSRSLAALGEMAAGIAHEIRNPLGAIRLDVEMIREDATAEPSIQLCSRVLSAVTRLDGIVGDVLSFARQSALSPQEVVLDQLLGSVLLELSQKLDSVAVDLRIDPEGLRISADRGLLSQVLVNIIQNACEAMEETGVEDPRILISCFTDRRRVDSGQRMDHVVIRVDDHGPGISEELGRQIFNPFFTTRQSGTGLGLAIVHRIVDAHGGHLVAGNAEHGARVEVCLPLEAREEATGMSAEGRSIDEAVRRRLNTHHDEGASP